MKSLATDVLSSCRRVYMFGGFTVAVFLDVIYRTILLPIRILKILFSNQSSKNTPMTFLCSSRFNSGTLCYQMNFDAHGFQYGWRREIKPNFKRSMQYCPLFFILQDIFHNNGCSTQQRLNVVIATFGEFSNDELANNEHLFQSRGVHKLCETDCFWSISHRS